MHSSKWTVWLAVRKATDTCMNFTINNWINGFSLGNQSKLFVAQVRTNSDSYWDHSAQVTLSFQNGPHLTGNNFWFISSNPDKDSNTSISHGHTLRQTLSRHSLMELATSATPALLITGFSLKPCQLLFFMALHLLEKFKDKTTIIRK